jgi:hypothetical protein
MKEGEKVGATFSREKDLTGVGNPTNSINSVNLSTQSAFILERYGSKEMNEF